MVADNAREGGSRLCEAGGCDETALGAGDACLDEGTALIG